MQNGTKKQSKKTAPVICAAVAAGVLLICLVLFLLPVFRADMEEAMASGVLILCAASFLAMIAGVGVALRQRLKEIDGGEEEDARQY